MSDSRRRNFWLQRQRERRKNGRESESLEIAEVEVEADAAVDVADVVVVEADVEAVLGEEAVTETEMEVRGNAQDLDPEEVICVTKYAVNGREKTLKEVQDDQGVGPGTEEISISKKSIPPRQEKMNLPRQEETNLLEE